MTTVSEVSEVGQRLSGFGYLAYVYQIVPSNLHFGLLKQKDVAPIMSVELDVTNLGHG